MEKGEILKRIRDEVAMEAADSLIQEVRIGIGYVGVRLYEDRLGLAAFPLKELPAGCTRFSGAGKVVDREASLLTQYLVEGTNPLEKALGLAAANAILQAGITDGNNEDTVSLMNLSSADRVAMVGLFTPMVGKIEATGASLAVIERDPARMAVRERAENERLLQECTVAVITATALLNGTMEETLGALGKPRHTAVLGPSTPLLPKAFAGTPVNHLGGAVAPYTRKVLQIISEGGGTPEMRPYLQFINLLL